MKPLLLNPETRFPSQSSLTFSTNSPCMGFVRFQKSVYRFENQHNADLFQHLDNEHLGAKSFYLLVQHPEAPEFHNPHNHL